MVVTNPAHCSDRKLSRFATIFGYMWYRDFPLVPTFRHMAKTADWTIHIGVAVRATADLMGLLTYFESGGRTDAVVRDNKEKIIAALEWEWRGLHKKNNELGKLRAHCQKHELEFAGLISWAPEQRKDEVLKQISQQWNVTQPLLLVTSHYEYLSAIKRKERKLKVRAGEFRGIRGKEMRFHRVVVGKEPELLFAQPVLPWEVEGSRWECLASRPS